MCWLIKMGGLFKLIVCGAINDDYHTQSWQNQSIILCGQIGQPTNKEVIMVNFIDSVSEKGPEAKQMA